MKLTTVGTLKSEIFTPITPPSVWTPLEKPLNECVVGFASACGVHLKTQKPYKTSGDRTWRKVPKDVTPDELMITHGGYDHTDVNKDINCMWPYQRMQELEDKGVIKHFCDMNAGFMGGGGDVELLRTKIGPEIAELFKEQDTDIVLMTAG
jgi:D-proline reductase (dithiol) PrdB